jgi:hypothetical protein
MRTTICDKIAITSVLAIAVVTVGCWIYALDAERRVEHLSLPPLVSLDATIAVGEGNVADESLASVSGANGDIGR